MTLNQIIAAIRRAGENHRMVRTVAVGPEYDLVADGGQDNYPLVMVFPDVVTMLTPDGPNDNAEKIFKFALAVMDRQFENSSNQVEVMSDTHQILEDLISTLRYVYRDSRAAFNLNDDALPFYDSRGDNVAGWAINLEVRVPYKQDFCAVPSNDYWFPNIDLDIKRIHGGFANSTYAFTIDGGIA
jgi:hypothetical protein